MKNLFFLLLAFFGLFNAGKAQGNAAQTQAEKNKATGFTITGNIQGLGDVPVSLVDVRGQIAAQGQAKGGMFVLKGNVEEPAFHQIIFGKLEDTKQGQKNPYLFLENAAIKITGSKADLKNLKIEGSTSQKEFVLFEQTFTPIFQNLNTVVTQINSAADAKKPALMKQYTDVLAKLQAEIEKFISQRPSSYVSLFTVAQTMQAADNIVDVEKRYNLLSEKLKSSAQGKEIASYISSAKIGAIGTEAMDFTQNDVNDKPVTLSSFRGKYVLVDFWASWCRPCRMENPNVVKVYNKFKDKNFTVLGVSLDQQKQAWVDAIQKDKLSWTHVSDLQYWNNAAAQLYKVQSIPQNFLIDPKGKIVAKDLRGEDLEKKLCEYLGCSN